VRDVVHRSMACEVICVFTNNTAGTGPSSSDFQEEDFPDTV